jgi:hypothetical protein
MLLSQKTFHFYATMFISFAIITAIVSKNPPKTIVALVLFSSIGIFQGVTRAAWIVADRPPIPASPAIMLAAYDLAYLSLLVFLLFAAWDTLFAHTKLTGKLGGQPRFA